MKTFKEFLVESLYDTSINKVSTEIDKTNCLKLCVDVFTDILGITEDDVLGELDDINWSKSYIAYSNDKPIGCYLLNTTRKVTEFSYCELEDLSQYENKRGIEGLALVVLPEYRNTGIGRLLRDKPLHLGYDYIFGQHFYGLDNKENWVKFGRRVVADDENEEFFVTLMDL